ncbi:MAG TPA: ABC transporter permease [Kofleriaceae bacterium]|nr:ABC transporter permease [Kofleriaceae bacterium]
MMTHEDLAASAVTERRRAWRQVAAGAVFVAAGIVLSFVMAGSRGWESWIPLGPAAVGLGLALVGVFRLGSYRVFVSWRYLLNYPPRVNPLFGLGLLVVLMVWARVLPMIGVPMSNPELTDPRVVIAGVFSLALIVAVLFYLLRHSRPGLYTFVACIAVAVLAGAAVRIFVVPAASPFESPTGMPLWLITGLAFVQLGAIVIAGLALFFGSLRAIFTFFTTVPIGGVWIGTSALVVVLAVMSGFETDLREKILGSNAHIQISREDGDFVNWREAKARIDKIPGVVASTPFAVSEVVIAANNNGMNVIIKGIDMATVGKVTDLIADLEDPEAVNRMEPLITDPRDRSIPQVPAAPANGPVVDPPPEDMPTGGDPIDFSKQDAGVGDESGDESDNEDARREDTRPDDTAMGTVLGPAPRDLFGGDAKQIVAATDPPPDDMLTFDEPPVDYSEPDAVGDVPVRVIDGPLEPSLSARTLALPGILVGRELVKQTHLYAGEEVRVVSPLSDPSNPDATGTPIPFNRDYRVAGVFFTGMYEYDLKYVYVTLDSLQDFLDRGDAVDGIEVRITDPDDTYMFVPTDDGPGRIREALGPGYRIQDWRELNRSLFSALKLEKIAMFLVLGIVILVASFSIVGNLIMVVVEKGREIALLKTLGASDAGVMQLFAFQGLLIGLIGTVLGVITGLITCWAGKHFGFPLNADVYYIDKLPIHVDPQSVLASAAAGVVISIAATFYPAMLASRVRPATGLRH